MWVYRLPLFGGHSLPGLPMNPQNRMYRTTSAYWLKATLCALACLTAHGSWAVDAYRYGPSYLVPETDNSWAQGWWATLDKPVAGVSAIPSTVLVDGVQKIDLATEAETFATLAKQPLIEIAVPGSGIRYVFTSMQNFTDFAVGADLDRVQDATEYAYYLVQEGKDPFTDLSWLQAWMDMGGKQSGAGAKALAVREPAVAAEQGGVAPTAPIPSSGHGDRKRLMPGGWDSDEAVWVMNYPYAACNYGQRGIVGPICGQSGSIGVLSKTPTSSGWGVQWYWPAPSGDDDDTAVVAARGRHQNHVYIGSILTTQICELDDGDPEFYNGRQGCSPDDSWLSGGFFTNPGGPRAYIMGRFADLTLSTQTQLLPHQVASDTRRTEMHVVNGRAVFVKSPVFWSFCTLFANCRRTFGGLPNPADLGVSMISWENFRLIPDARAAYFNLGVSSSMTVPDIQQTAVSTYREQASARPGLAGYYPDQGLRLSALVEAASGCDAIVLPPEYLDTSYNPPRRINRGRSCVLPRAADGGPLFQMRDQVSGGYAKTFFHDEFCMQQANPSACIQAQRNPCELRYLDTIRYDLTGVLGLGLGGTGFATCSRLYQRPH